MVSVISLVSHLNDTKKEKEFFITPHLNLHINLAIFTRRLLCPGVWPYSLISRGPTFVSRYTLIVITDITNSSARLEDRSLTLSYPARPTTLNPDPPSHLNVSQLASQVKICNCYE